MRCPKGGAGQQQVKQKSENCLWQRGTNNREEGKEKYKREGEGVWQMQRRIGAA